MVVVFHLKPILRWRCSSRTQVTTKGSFNSFAMLSFDGKKIAWCSNRDAAPGDYSTIDIYVADWVGDGFDEANARLVEF